MARAVMRLGPLLLGEDWSERVVTLEGVPRLPRFPDSASLLDKQFAMAVLDHLQPWRRAPMLSDVPAPTTFGGLGGMGGIPFGALVPYPTTAIAPFAPSISIDEWEVVLGEMERLERFNANTYSMRHRIIESLSQIFFDRGMVSLWVTPLKGGRPAPLDPGFWNAKPALLDHVLKNCSICLHDPLDPSAEPDHNVLLILPQFEQVIASLPLPTQPLTQTEVDQGALNPDVGESLGSELDATSPISAASPGKVTSRAELQSFADAIGAGTVVIGPREQSQRFRGERGRPLTEVRDIVAQILVAEFGATGGVGRAAGRRYSTAVDWWTAHRKAAGKKAIPEPDLRARIRDVDKVLFKINS